ncbi:disease resistance protein RPV1 [Manihot esculenta]|uniref:disease resistance protein RPV1 n=1 Tax=Manihot esculenta TaxID=3983 RepID=UPI001CC7D845|nr:disease resistance protein RPV1 [Manihot esculenta]
MEATSSTPPCKYDVFISFRGKDIRGGFLSHLFDALQRKQINPFMDENLRKGEEISPALLETIQDSYVSIVVFSQNYADSPWCLDELVKILECKEILGQLVLPIFYHVDPTDIQDLIGNFGEAFAVAEHGEEFKGCLDKVDKWRRALMEISNLSGWDSKKIKSESKLVEEIANDVCKKLSLISSSDSYNDNFVGIESRLKKVESLLCIESKYDRRVIGIWGMGGIGKTTIALQVLNRIMDKFDGHYFVDNVREKMRKQTHVFLDEIINQLLGEKDLRVSTSLLPPSTRRRLQSKKVVIVFDDVDDPNHLKLLAGECALYHNGSRIIVTSRDRQVLKNVCSEGYIYEVEKLTDDEALCLFSLYTFKQLHPKKGYVEISKKLITYAQGIPLALVILGSNLYDKGIEEWESELEKLKEIPDMNIQAVLRISYDGLERHEKSIFLDIACFLKGEPKDRVERIFEGCGFFPRRAISRLIDKSLITVSNGKVGMHDLLQQMGKDVVCEESKQLGTRSRLWKYKDICHVLTRDKGTENIEGILLDTYGNGYLELSPTAFMNMCNLRFLKFFNVSTSGPGRVLLPSGLEFLPKELRYLHWEGYPLKSLPINFCPRNLVELRMPHSNLIQLWNQEKALESLKFLDLSCSFELTKVPDLSSAPNLEVLCLIGCSNLIEIPSSVGECKCLKEIDLVCCSKLHSIPQSICNSKSLTRLDITGCRNVKALPENMGDLELLKNLYTCGSGIKTLPSSINQLRRLEELRCVGCKGLTLPPLTGLSCVREIDLSDCGILEIPQSLWFLVSLEELHLGGNNFKTTPASIKHLTELKELLLKGCKRLKCLPELPSCLKDLDASECTSLESASTSFLFLEHDDEKEAKRLEFRNCINLDKNVHDKVMEDVLKTHLLKHKIVKLCIAGVEVPETMRYKNKSGSSLSFRLDQGNLTGFSLCAVFDPKNYSHDLDIAVKFSFASIARHSFKPTCRLDRDYDSIIMCGVHPIFREDRLSRDKKRSRIEEDKEDEPSLQRLKNKTENLRIRTINHQEQEEELCLDVDH